MSEPIETVVRVANTPAQAKIFAAMLQAEGIPARVEGDSLTDEFAASRRLLNLVGTRVLVPTKSLERAQEILQPVVVDAAELEREAMATPGEVPPPPRPERPRAASKSNGVPLLLAGGAAVLFALLWQKEVNAAMAPHPELDYAWHGDAVRETLRRDGRLLRLLHDRERDGIYEQIDQFDAAGKKVTTADQEVAGIYARFVESRSGDLTVTWTDEDRDGIHDVGIVTDRDGKVVQRVGWQSGTGFVLKGP